MDDEDDTADVNPVELAFFPKTSPDAGAYATIKILPEVKMDDESAWLGLCPAGKNYITEIEADESEIKEFDNARLDEINDRLGLYSELKRKYKK